MDGASLKRAVQRMNAPQSYVLAGGPGLQLRHGPAIYVTDKERKQSFAEAVRTYDVMLRVYEELGYKMQELPLCAVAERDEFVLHNLGSAGCR